MDLRDKRICLVLSCKRPYYMNRRNRYAEQYEQIRDKGFVVIFLYGEVGRRELLLEEGELALYVPVQDLYKNLTTKMILAYEYLLEKGVAGILKMDDDVQMRDASILDGELTQADYSGAQEFRVNGGHTYPLKTTSEMFYVDTRFQYFTGPFYWLSRKGLEQVIKVGVKYPWEDINIGYCISLDSSLNVCNTHAKGKQVVWYDEHEHDGDD
jgi:hypothetical protein